MSFAKPVFLLTAAVAGLIYTAAYSGIATARILGMENTALVVFICWGYVILFVLLGWYITTVIKKYKEL